MPDRVRVYPPDSNEPFDVPVEKAGELRLNHGWRSTPFDSTAKPSVETLDDRGTALSSDECTLLEDWRDSEFSVEIDGNPKSLPLRRPKSKSKT